ncbi:MAG: hypothetical protein N3A71_01245 [Candidatus Dojkabacteria bacterium]|nr:hypothetical protein [Candidatus Dojkabacteria bacterium]
MEVFLSPDVLIWVFILAIFAGMIYFLYLVIVFILDDIRRDSYAKYTDDLTYFIVRVPKNNEYDISNAVQMYSSLHSLLENNKFSFIANPQKIISFEVVAFRQKIIFYVVCSSSIADSVEKQILGAYPKAEVLRSSDYNLFFDDCYVEFAELRLKKESYYPILTHEKDRLVNDPMNVLTSTIAKLQDNESFAVQFLMTPANDSWAKEGRSLIKSVDKQMKDPENKSGPSIPQEVIQLITDKISKVGFDLTIRLISVSYDELNAKRILTTVKDSFGQFTNAQGNSFTEYKPKGWLKSYLRKKNIINDFINRIPPIWAKQSVLNVSELATVFHFPNKNVETPFIDWLLAKMAPAHESVHTKGVWLGVANFRGMTRDVCMGNIDDRRRHMYIIGQTGTGKSKFMDNLALQDINAGHGICFIDPHGEEVEWLLERIPPHRIEDVIYWDPGDFERPFGFNILENYSEEDKHAVVNSFYAMIQKLFDPNNQGITGPVLERAIRSTLLLAMSKPGTTLIEAMKCLLLDWNVINHLLQYATDPFVIDYWTKEVPSTPENRRGELLGYFTSKLDRFISNRVMRNMLGQSKSAFELRQVMDSGKILLINLSKGRIGKENSEFLGLLLVPKILRAAMTRVDIPQEKRKDFFLYVDEFQNFATDSFAEILSEARKFRLNLTVANQYTGQMRKEIRDAVFGNVGTIVAFRVGPDDAPYLEEVFSPTFDKNDLLNLPNQTAYIKLMVDGRYVDPFSIKTTFKKWPQGNPTIRDIAIQISRTMYGKDKAIVEEDILRRMNPDPNAPKATVPVYNNQQIKLAY